jgi:WD40 repeat protein
MSAHYTCLQGHTWSVDEGTNVCPVCGARAPAPPAAIVEDEPPPPPGQLLTPRLDQPDVPTPAEPRPVEGWTTATVGLLALIACLLLLVAVGFVWLTISARGEAARQRTMAEDAARDAEANRKTALEKTDEVQRARDFGQKQREAADKEREQAEQKLLHAQEQLAQRDQQQQRQRYLAQIARVESIWEHDPLRASKMLEQCNEKDRDFAWGVYRKLCTTGLAEFKAHDDAITVVAVSPNGKLAASAADTVIKVWDLATRKEIATLTDHTQPIHDLQFSPDSKRLASRCNNPGKAGELYLWNLGDEKITGQSLKGHQVPVTGMAFSPDGKLLISCSGEANDLGNRAMEARVWNAETGKEKRSFPIPERGQGFFSIAISPDSKRYAVGTGGTAAATAIHVVEVDSGRDVQKLTGQNGWITGLAFADNNTLVSGNREIESQAIKIWNVETGKERATFTLEPEKDGVVAVRVLGDGKTIAAWSKLQLKLWDLESETPRSLALSGPFWSANAIAFSPDGTTLAVPHRTVGSSVEVTFWDVPSAKDHGSYSLSNSNFDVVAFTPDGQTMLTGWNDGKLRILNARTAQESTSVLAHKPADEQRTVLAISPDGKYLATGGADHIVRLWSLAGGDAVELIDHEAPVTCLAFGWMKLPKHDDKSLLLFSGDRSEFNATRNAYGLVKIWNVATGKDTGLENMQDKEATISSIAVSPDGTHWAWGNPRGHVKVNGDLNDPKVTSIDKGDGEVNGLMFSPDGKYLAMARANSEVRVWDAAGKKEKFVLTGHKASANGVAFSRDGKLLASVSGDPILKPDRPVGDSELKLWDMTTGKELPIHKQGNIRGKCIAFSPDGRTIATGGMDGLIRLWDVLSGDEETTLTPRHEAGKQPPAVTGIAFTIDGKTLYSVDEAGVLKSWQVLGE